MMTTATFPIELDAFVPLDLDPAAGELDDAQHEQLAANIQLCRDAIVFFTATGAARGLGGHTGGPYDIVPEVLIADAFARADERIMPVWFDEAGHRVAIQYLMAVLAGLPIGALIGGFLADAFSIATVMLVYAALMVLAATRQAATTRALAPLDGDEPTDVSGDPAPDRP